MKSLRAISSDMEGFAHNQIGQILKGESAPVNGSQARMLVRALGGGADEENLAAALFAKIEKERTSDSPSRTGSRPVTAMAETKVQLALSKAIQRYATTGGQGSRARPFLASGGLITDSDIVTEFRKEITAGGSADTRLIGERWKAAMGAVADDADYTAEAKVLVGYFRDEAKLLEPLQGAVLIDLVEKLPQALADLLNLVGQRTKPPPLRLRPHVDDQSGNIVAWSRDFVGRYFAFEWIREFLKSHDRGYLLIGARPGVGKTALLAKLVRDTSYVHHFNRRTGNVTSPQAFLRNVCAQLITKYELPHESLPDGATENSLVLEALMREAAEAHPDSKIVIAVDALDEADTSKDLAGCNPLYLPATLPKNCYFVITTRTNLRNDPPSMMLDQAQARVIDHLGDVNMADIAVYIRQQLRFDRIRKYVDSRKYSDSIFIDELGTRSEGNFMYLYHVLSGIKNGPLDDLSLAELPNGLRNYYDQHLKRMRAEDPQAWTERWKPVLVALATIQAPMTEDQIAKEAGVTERTVVRDALRAWGQFIHRATHAQKTTYRIYHSSFQEYLFEEASPLRTDLTTAQQQFRADVLSLLGIENDRPPIG